LTFSSEDFINQKNEHENNKVRIYHNENFIKSKKGVKEDTFSFKEIFFTLWAKRVGIYKISFRF